MQSIKSSISIPGRLSTYFLFKSLCAHWDGVLLTGVICASCSNLVPSEGLRHAVVCSHGLCESLMTKHTSLPFSQQQVSPAQPPEKPQGCIRVKDAHTLLYASWGAKTENLTHLECAVLDKRKQSQPFPPGKNLN